jgi:NAD(P)-dependent dehydrogenase (short-subunit alcohol dehydrogenase family)
MNDALVVTGSAGALGRAVLRELRDAGREVIAMDVASAALDEVGALDGVHAVPANLADPDAVRAAWAHIDTIAGPTALVALAGGFAPGSLADLDVSTLDGLWRSNVVSLLWSCHEAAPRIAAAGGGAIVTVGSRTAVTGVAPIVHATTKSAVVRASELLADELRPQRIRVNCVLPSVIDTPANRSWMSADLAARAVAPAAIARVIAFLVDPSSAAVSGARIPVYGDA